MAGRRCRCVELMELLECGLGDGRSVWRTPRSADRDVSRRARVASRCRRSVIRVLPHPVFCTQAASGTSFVSQPSSRNHRVVALPRVSRLQAVYLDDELSGITVVNNTFIDCQTGVLVGGGRDNDVSDNIFAHVDLPVDLDNRGMGWQAAACAYNATYAGILVQGLFAVNYTYPPYATAYPQLPGLLQDHLCVPVNNTVRGNTYCNSTKGFISATANQTASWLDVVTDNVEFMGC